MTSVERLQYIIDAINNAHSELEQLQDDFEGVDRAATKTDEGGLAQLKKGWVAAGAAAVVFGVAAKKAYEFTKEGARLELEEERFYRLAQRIGTTGEALRSDLIPTMRGMMTEAEGVGLATQLMSLGLAKSHDEAIRLTRAASALDMPLNDLILTLTNMRTMRFDQLNMSVDGFQTRLDRLEGTMSDEDAFKMAFLEQAEAQIEKVGDAADSTYGKIERLENTWKNYMDALKMGLADVIVPFLDAQLQQIEMMELIRRAQELGIDTTEEAWLMSGYLKVSEEELTEAKRVLLEQIQDEEEAIRLSTDGLRQYAGWMSTASEKNLDFVGTGQELKDKLILLAQAQRSVGDEMERLDQRTYGAADAMRALEAHMWGVAGATRELDGSFANNATMAGNMLDEWEWAMAGGADLEAVLREIGSMQVSPEVKKALLEEAYVTAVKLDVKLGELTSPEGAQAIALQLDISDLDATMLLLSGPDGIEDDLETLDAMVSEADLQIDDQARGPIDELFDKGEEWDRSTFTATFKIDYKSGGGGGGGGNGDDGPREYQHGTGGWLTVPPGYPNDSFLAGLSSGERLNVVPQGQRLPGPAGNVTTLIWYGDIIAEPGFDIIGFLDDLAARQARDRASLRAGAGYTGV